MLTFNSLGGIQLLDESGAPKTLRSRKHIGLLLFMFTSERRVHTRRRLCELFWSTPQERARHSLSQAVYDITRQLGPLVHRGPGGDLAVDRSAICYDVTRFEAAVREGDLAMAVDLYQGPFAGNLVDAGTEDFERWLEAERTRLARLGELALRRYLDDCEAKGRWGDMCVAALRLASLTPLDEDVHRTFMRALWLQGDAASALRHYESVVTELSSELPGGLSPATRELAERIRRTPNPTVDLPRAVDREPPFVGREEEFQELRSLAGEIESAEVTSIVISGEAGIGKSRLLKEFAQSLIPDPVRLIVSRCYQAEEDLPYSPVVDGLQPLVNELVGTDRSIRERYRKLAYLLPDFGMRDAGEEKDSVDPGAWRRQLYEEVASFLAEVTRREPIIWILDDVQWIDRTSAGLYHYLARRLAGRPFLIALTVRNARGADGLPPLPVPSPVGSSDTRSLPLRPLSEEHVRSIVQHAEPEGLGHPAAELAVRLSGGNPYYALEVLEAASESKEWARTASGWDPLNDDRLRTVLDVRLSGLSSSALRVLRSIAVLERHARARLVAKVSELTMGEAARMAEELYTRSLIIDDGDRIAFTNDTMREFVSAGMTALQRAALHLNAGNALEAEPSPPLGALATHFFHGDDWHRAYGYAMEAAGAAQTSAGHIEAAHFAGIAATAAPGADECRVALEIRADSLYAAGELAEAAACYREMLQGRSEMGAGSAAQIRLHLSEVLTENCQWGEAGACLAEALSTIHRVEDENQRLRYIAEYCTVSLRRASRIEDREAADEAKHLLEQAATTLDESRPPSPGTFFAIQVALAVEVAISGSTRQALTHIAEAEKFLNSANKRQTHRFILFRGVLRAWMGQWDGAEADFSWEATRATKMGDLVALATAKNNLACVALERGNWTEASEHIHQAAAVASSLDQKHDAKVAILTNKANLLFYQGFSKDALEAYMAAQNACKEQGSQSDVVEIASCLGLLALQRGDRKAAIRVWESISDTRSGSTLGARDRFKFHWFAWAMGELSRSDLQAALDLERDRDLPSHLKLRWLAATAQGTESGELEDLRTTLAEYELGWFCHVSRRWSRMAQLAPVTTG